MSKLSKQHADTCAQKVRAVSIKVCLDEEIKIIASDSIHVVEEEFITHIKM